MDKKEIQIYLNGLFDIASSVSKRMGPSYAEPYVFEKGGGEIKEFFGFGAAAFEETTCTLADYLSDTFESDDGDKKLCVSLEYHVTETLGKAREIAYLKDEYYKKLESKKSPVPFYTVEAAALVKFKDYYVVIVTGNNE